MTPRLINWTPPRNSIATVSEAYPGTSTPQNIALKSIHDPRAKASAVANNPKYVEIRRGKVEKDVIPSIA